MLSIHIAVPPGKSVEWSAKWNLLLEAHRKRLHLKEPVKPKLTPMQNSMSDLARVMGIDPSADHRFYKVECETVPCGEDDHPRDHPDD